ncbi:hypothetical protein [Mesorhizobium sp. LMG17149]|uniref:hypothetical protein n=1 Tax=Mesorhizobium sp. LMG17149 TaxID=2968497 RepID=UPI002741D4DD|nr:hypothetical protein [Mesorhizobium sp. LMG17149]
MNRLKELGSLLNETGRENTAARSGREAVPAAVMKRAHLEKLQLCAALEKIADTLPRVDPLACLTLANAIVRFCATATNTKNRLSSCLRDRPGRQS